MIIWNRMWSCIRVPKSSRTLFNSQRYPLINVYLGYEGELSNKKSKNNEPINYVELVKGPNNNIAKGNDKN